MKYRRTGQSPEEAWSDAGHTGTTTTVTITGLKETTQYEVRVRAFNDEGVGPWSQSVTDSTVANRAPVIGGAESVTITVAENTATGTDIGDAFSASDSDNDTITWSLKGTDAALFAIGAAGQLSTNAELNHEESATRSITVVASDGNGNEDTVTVTVNVSDMNEPSGRVVSLAVTEQTADSLTVSWTAPDMTGKPPITRYYLHYRPSVGYWENFYYPGLVTSATIGNLTAGTHYKVRVRTKNDEGGSTWSMATGVTESVMPPENRAPAITGTTTSFTVAENNGQGTQVGAPFTASDPDPGDTITWSLTGADAASFTISASGQLSIAKDVTLDYETQDSHSITVVASDGNGKEDTVTVTVNVSDVNEPPGQAVSLAVTEQTTDSLTLTWTAPDTTGKPPITGYDVQYRQTGQSPEAAWSDAGHTGTATTATITGLKETTQYEVRVRAFNDEGAGPWSASVTDSTAANRAPVIGGAESVTITVAENTATGTDIGDAFSASDSDNDTITWSLKGTDAALFTISASGQLSIAKDVTLDYETQDSRDITVVASDGNGNEDTVSVTVNVSDVNEPPGQAVSLAVTEQTADSLTLTWTAPDTTGKPPITGYDVQYRLSGGSWTDYGHSSVVTSATIGNLTIGTTYDVRVHAKNDEGDGAWSSITTITKTPPAPDTPILTPGDGQLDVSWTMPDTDETPVTGYTVQWKMTPPTLIDPSMLTRDP